MGELKILLACGNGASSGYLAMQARKAAKKKNLNCRIEAVPISNVGSMVQAYDIVMVGPHHAYDMESIEQICNGHNIPSVLIPKKIYSSLDGDGLINLCLETLEKNKEKI